MDIEIKEKIELFEKIAEKSQVLYTAQQIDTAVRRIAAQLNQDYSGTCPLVLSVMGGSVVFSGHLIPLLDFAMDFDHIYVSRYGDALLGGGAEWRLGPQMEVSGRHVIVLDDAMNQGHTMRVVRDRLALLGAADIKLVVLCDKTVSNGKQKLVSVDYVGFQVPEGSIYGYGMDINGLARNLLDIRFLDKNWRQ